MLKEQSALSYFKTVPFSFPCWKHDGIFLRYSLWEPGQSPEGKSHNIVGLSLCLGPLEFLTLRFVHTEPLAIRPLQLRFSYGLLNLCSSKTCLPAFSVCPSNLGDKGLPCVLPLLQILKKLIFQVSFLLVVRTECDF